MLSKQARKQNNVSSMFFLTTELQLYNCVY